MKYERLEGVLRRNRRHLLLDVALAALFPLALFLSGWAVGAELPKLSSAARAAPAAPAPGPAATGDVDSAPACTVTRARDQRLTHGVAS